MMQTEMMFRLLVKDENSPSGYEIVGYEWHSLVPSHGCIILCSIDMEHWYERVNSLDVKCDSHVWERLDYTKYIDIGFDSFELGIKVGDEFWFEGDRIMEMFDIGGQVTVFGRGTIMWDRCCFTVAWDNGIWSDLLTIYEPPRFKLIGSIHEEKE